MPFESHRPSRLAAACALTLAALSLPAFAQEDKAQTPSVKNSDLDAPLFYQLLVGELELRNGEAGIAYQVLLDAARRTQDEALFKRVVQIALQAHAGDQAANAAKAWRETLPNSVEAHETQIQLLALLNRPQEVSAPLQSLLKLTAEDQRGALIRSLPGLFTRAPEPQRVYDALRPVLDKAAKEAPTQAAALATTARLALKAEQAAPALAATLELARLTPDSDEVLELALELMPQSGDAEALVRKGLAEQPLNKALRAGYGRALARSQRLGEAATEFRQLTEQAPADASSWFALGSLELELRRPDEAEKALKTFLARLEEAAGQDDKTQLTEAGREARQQAWMLLASAAEQRRDWKTAQDWLDKLKDLPPRTDLQYRRAVVAAHQGRLQEARELIRALPGDKPETLRLRYLAEAQLLRDMEQWPEALELLREANDKVKDDADLLYEQAMMAEKLDRVEEMEAVLRRVIAINPKHFHAYNALGYSWADRKMHLQEARELIVKALTLAPKEPSIVDSMGWVEYRLGRLGDAERLLREAYASRPDTDIAVHLGEVLWSAGRQDEARQIWTEGAKKEPDNESLRETLKRLKVSF